jgi:hypothetical protein
MSIKSYTTCFGKKRPSGTKRKIWLVKECDVDATSWPTKLATTGTGDSITLDGDITLLATKAFAVIDVIPDTGKVTNTPEGSRTGRSYTNKFDFKLDYSAGALEWVNENVNVPMIGIVEQKDGSLRVLGEPGIPAFLEASEATGGDAPGSEASIICQLMDSVGEVAPFYTGAIDVTA